MDIADKFDQMKLSEKESNTIHLDKIGKGKVQENVQHCLIGKVISNKTVNVDAFKRVMRKAWSFCREIAIESAGDNLFMIKLGSEQDRMRIQSGGPWCFDRSIILLETPSVFDLPEKMKFETATFWIQFHNVPIGYRTEQTARILGSRVGKVLHVGTNDADECWGRFLRVRVQVNILEPLCRCLSITGEGSEQVWISIRYERLPDFCYNCGLIGHVAVECSEEGEKESQELEQQTGVKPFGPWMKADEWLSWYRQEGRRADGGRGRGRGRGFDVYQQQLEEPEIQSSHESSRIRNQSRQNIIETELEEDRNDPKVRTDSNQLKHHPSRIFPAMEEDAAAENGEPKSNGGKQVCSGKSGEINEEIDGETPIKETQSVKLTAQDNYKEGKFPTAPYVLQEMEIDAESKELKSWDDGGLNKTKDSGLKSINGKNISINSNQGQGDSKLKKPNEDMIVALEENRSDQIGPPENKQKLVSPVANIDELQKTKTDTDLEKGLGQDKGQNLSSQTTKRTHKWRRRAREQETNGEEDMILDKCQIKRQAIDSSNGQGLAKRVRTETDSSFELLSVEPAKQARRDQ